MELTLGENIKNLRKRDKRTQENLATALGITFQAVSRWESGVSYPDMELVPSIANYFGVTIDELFGYDCERNKIVNSIIEKVNEFHYQSDGSDEWVNECIAILREGLARFPQNEKLMSALSDVLYHAGWRRHRNWVYYASDGYMRHDYDPEKKNEYWRESANICEYLTESSTDPKTVNSAVKILISLYRNFGENEKAIKCAEILSPLNNCREIALCEASVGKEEAKFSGKALISMARQFAETTVYTLVNNLHNFKSDMPIKKISDTISFINDLCDNEFYGVLNETLIELYLYISRLQWEKGYKDEAFLSLDKAYFHATEYENICDGEVHFYKGALLKEVSFKKFETPVHCMKKSLPENWPVWTNPDYREVEKEIKADPRWDMFIKKCAE